LLKLVRSHRGLLLGPSLLLVQDIFYAVELHELLVCLAVDSDQSFVHIDLAPDLPLAFVDLGLGLGVLLVEQVHVLLEGLLLLVFLLHRLLLLELLLVLGLLGLGRYYVIDLFALLLDALVQQRLLLRLGVYHICRSADQVLNFIRLLLIRVDLPHFLLPIGHSGVDLVEKGRLSISQIFSLLFGRFLGQDPLTMLQILSNLGWHQLGIVLHPL